MQHPARHYQRAALAQRPPLGVGPLGRVHSQARGRVHEVVRPQARHPLVPQLNRGAYLVTSLHGILAEHRGGGRLERHQVMRHFHAVPLRLQMPNGADKQRVHGGGGWKTAWRSNTTTLRSIDVAKIAGTERRPLPPFCARSPHDRLVNATHVPAP